MNTMEPVIIFIVLIIVLIIALVACYIIGKAWEKKGLSFKGGFGASFFFSPFVSLLLGIMLTRPKAEIEGETHIFCPYCGAKNPKENKKCVACGKDLQNVLTPSEYQCEICGSYVSEDANYCSKCGSKLED